MPEIVLNNFLRGNLFNVFQVEIIIVLSLNAFYFKLDKLSIAITSSVMNIDGGAKSFGKRFVLQSISCFKVIRIFNN